LAALGGEGIKRKDGSAPSMKRALTSLLALLMFAPALAGCLTDAPGKTKGDPQGPAYVMVETPEGQPLGYAQATLVRNGTPLVIFSADANGRVLVPKGVSADSLIVGFPGTQSMKLPLDALPAKVALRPLTSPANATALLNFLPSVNLECPTDAVATVLDEAFRRSCGGFGEPVMEVAGDGTIWASATCCIGRSPPIWISRDGGLSFKLHNPVGTGVVRDGFGIEGDFAIDSAGNVYFFDIGAAFAWFTSYKADGSHRWTIPIALPPLVDRPWVRAGAADEVYIFYNTGFDTRLYASKNGGLTWDMVGAKTIPCALSTFGQGPDPKRLFMVGCSGAPQLWLSTDGGVTLNGPENVPVPKGNYEFGRGIDRFMPPSSDENGTIYVPFTHVLDDQGEEKAIFVSRRASDGTWSGPFQVSPGGRNEKPWSAAGRAGHLGIAWYNTPSNSSARDSAVWHVMAAASINADAPQPHFQITRADPDPVLQGVFGRALGDFLEARMTPDGRLAIVYSRNMPGMPYENRFVQTDGGLDLGPDVFRNGPAKP
jgi:hypothetical protein